VKSRGKRKEQEMIFRVLSLNPISGGQGADTGQTDSVILIKRVGLAMYLQEVLP